MVTRRDLLLAAVSVLFPIEISANNALPKSNPLARNSGGAICWAEFLSVMQGLADAKASGRLKQELVAERGMQYLQQLDIGSTGFKFAVDTAYESGNRYWLWQRLMKSVNINGGILSINSNQLVQLHDHPGATGIVRIISGEIEVWQFDEVSSGKIRKDKNAEKANSVELVKVVHRVLKTGDLAVLTPEQGNIHALRAVSKQCRMLDFFIPPYVISQRSWYEPLIENWCNKERITCRKIPHHEFLMAYITNRGNNS